MTTYNTGNPIGSIDPRDLLDNAQNLDTGLLTDQPTFQDRLGRTRVSWEGAISYSVLSETYAAGIEVTTRNQVILANGEYWKVAGSTVLPYVTTGAGMPEFGAFVSVGDAVLRQDLTAPGGAGLVGNAAIEFDSVADMQGATWLTIGQKVRTLGYYTPGDGGGNDYEIVAAGVGTDDGGSFIDLAGSGLQAKGLFTDGHENPFQFGLRSNFVDDDAIPLETYLNFTKTPLLNGLSCRITRMLSITTSTDYELTAINSLILLDTTEPQEKVVNIITTGQRIIVSGSLAIDANNNAFCGLYIDGLTSERDLCVVDGVTVRNIYRIDTRFTLGDGIFIRGGFKKLTATNFIIENVKMAAGAGVPFSFGVTGITIFRYSTAVHSNDITVSNFSISNIYSEDRTYLMRDQDGVRVTQSYQKSYISTELTQPSRALVSNGRLLNAMGRAVKMVSEYGIVENIQIVRNENIHTNFTMTDSEDIDFQCAGGTIRGIRCHYYNNVPYSLVNFNVNIVGGRRTPTQCLIDDAVVSLYGSLGMNAIVAAVTSNPISDTGMIKVVVNDSSVTGAVINLDSVVTLNNGANISPLYFFVSVANTTARLGTSLVKRTNPTVENSLLLTSCANQNTGSSTVPASTGLSTVNDQISIIGTNRRIS